MIKLSRAYLCPGAHGEEHITDNPNRCICGCTNLVPLVQVLEGKANIKSEEKYCMLDDMPQLKETLQLCSSLSKERIQQS